MNEYNDHIKESIDYFNDVLECRKHQVNNCDMQTSLRLGREETAFQTAIVALYRQIPTKPKEYEDKYYGCPTCGNVLLHKWQKYPDILMPKENGLPYCLGCGQAIDWTEGE